MTIIPLLLHKLLTSKCVYVYIRLYFDFLKNLESQGFVVPCYSPLSRVRTRSVQVTLQSSLTTNPSNHPVLCPSPSRPKCRVYTENQGLVRTCLVGVKRENILPYQQYGGWSTVAKPLISQPGPHFHDRKTDLMSSRSYSWTNGVR